jgi:plastocyanin
VPKLSTVRLLLLAGVLVAGALLAAALLTACGPSAGDPPPPPPGAIPAGQQIGGAAIEGRVVFTGTPPPRKPIRMTSEAACHRPDAETLTEEVVVAADGGLKNVWVRVVSGLGERVFAPPAETAVMDQAGCVFKPHLLAVQTNQVITFTNSDPVLHNVRAVARKNRGFNLSMPGHGRTVRRFFGEPEIVSIRCDLHPWMNAVIAVESHPFHRVTGDEGGFAIRGLPAGDYEVEAWHEKLGTRRAAVTLAADETRRLEIAFAAK